MAHIRISLAIMIMGAVFLTFAGSAEAQATRTWVSGVGDDANPCSRTAPCKTFAGAISKTTAAGEIDVLDPGGFGAVTITKAISIIDDGVGTGGVLVSGANGIIVSAGASDNVVLRGLAFEGLGTATNGIQFNSGASLIVQNTTIHGFTGSGISFQPSTMADLTVTDSKITENNPSGTGAGILIQPTAGSAQATISNVVSNYNHAGIIIGGTNGSVINVTISNSVMDSDLANGIVATSGSAITTVAIDHSVASNDPVGIHADGANSTIYLGNSTAAGDTFALKTTNGGTLYSYGNNSLNGNTEVMSGTVKSTTTQ